MSSSLLALATRFYTKLTVSHWPHPRIFFNYFRSPPDTYVACAPGLNMPELVFVQHPRTVVIAMDALFSWSHCTTFVVSYFSFVYTYSMLFLDVKLKSLLTSKPSPSQVHSWLLELFISLYLHSKINIDVYLVICLYCTHCGRQQGYFNAYVDCGHLDLDK